MSTHRESDSLAHLRAPRKIASARASGSSSPVAAISLIGWISFDREFFEVPLNSLRFQLCKFYPMTMWRQVSTRIFLFFAFALATTLSGVAQEVDKSINLENTPQNQQPIPASGSRVPMGTAVVGRFLLDTVLDPARKYDLPVTMLTALPVYDENGSAVFPEGSLITALIQKRSGGDYITIDRIVYRGLNIPVPSLGRLIPAQVKPENYGNYITPPRSKASSVFGAADQSSLIPTLLAIAIAGTFNTDESGNQKQNITPLVLGVVAADVGIKFISALFDNGPMRLPPLVEIPKDSLLVFTMDSDLNLPFVNSPDTTLPRSSE